MINVIHKTQGYSAIADEVRKNLKGEVIAVHIPIIGWKDAREFDLREDNK